MIKMFRKWLIFLLLGVGFVVVTALPMVVLYDLVIKEIEDPYKAYIALPTLFFWNIFIYDNLKKALNKSE